MSIFSLFKKQKPSLAFSLDNGFVRWICLMREKEGIQVIEYGSEFFGADIINAQDSIIDDAAFVRKLRLISEKIIASTKAMEANIVIPDHQAVMFHTHVAKVDDKQMGDVIVDHIKAYCQINQLLELTEYICEYDIILKTDFGYDIHVTLVPKLYVAHLARLFKQAGIAVRHIETAHHAVAKSCLNIKNGTGYALVSFGEKQTSVSLIHGEHLVSNEVVAVGVENIYKTVERFLAVSRNDAMRIIQRHGVLKTHPDNGLLSELYLELAPIYRTIDRQLIELGQLPYKIFGHRFTTNDLIVYGEGVWIKGLVPFLGERTNLLAWELDVWAGHHEDRAPILNLPAVDTLTYAEPLSLGLLYLDNEFD